MQTGLGGNDPDSREKTGQRGPGLPTIRRSEHTLKPLRGCILELFKWEFCRQESGPILGTVRILGVWIVLSKEGIHLMPTAFLKGRMSILKFV